MSQIEDFEVESDAVDLPRGATAQARRLKVSWRGRAITALSQSAFRAYLFPVFTPSGVPVTAEAAVDHPHHSSITVGADHFVCAFPFSTDRFEDGTYNFYVNDVFQGRAPGRTWSTSVESEQLAEDHLRIVQTVAWQGPQEWGAPDRRVLAEETRTFDVHPGDGANVIDVRSQLRPTQWDISLGPTRHAYFTVRLADGLREADGGSLVDSEGRAGAATVSGKVSDWVDASGLASYGRHAGIAVFPHPSAAGHPWSIYDWGSIMVNPIQTEGRTVSRGETLDLGMRVVAHDGNAREARVAELYDAFKGQQARSPSS